MEQLFAISKSTYFPSDPSAGTLGSIDLNLNFLQKCGLPLFGVKELNVTYQRMIIVYGFVVLTLFRLPYFSFEIYDLVFSWRNLNDVTQNMCLSMLHLGGMLKMTMIFSRLEDFNRISEQFELMAKRYVKSEKQLKAFLWNEFENKFCFTLYCSFTTTASALGVVFLYTDPSILERAFPYRAKLPDGTPISFKLVYMPLAVMIVSVQTTGVDYLNVTFINLTRGQLEVLNIAFDELNESVVGRVTVDKLRHLYGLIEHHNFILDVRKQIESVFKFPMLVQFSASLLIFAVTGFQALVRSDTSGIVVIYVYVGCILVQLFLHCWFGNEVSEQNKTLASRGYDTTWYEFDIKFRKSLLMFLMNAQKPFYFTAGGYADLSLLTFSRILSKSYTFVAVLRQQYTSK